MAIYSSHALVAATEHGTTKPFPTGTPGPLAQTMVQSTTQYHSPVHMMDPTEPLVPSMGLADSNKMCIRKAISLTEMATILDGMGHCKNGSVLSGDLTGRPLSLTFNS